MARVILLAGLLCAAVAAAPARGEVPSVGEVMRRVAAYVDQYGTRTAIFVATERYTQQARSTGRTAPRQRRLLADFAIVRVESLRTWQGFRDVLEVDGEAVADRDDRLVRLLTQAGGHYGDARRLSDESARFNIGAIQRNFNVPTTALFFFERENLDRFTFTARTVDAAGIWEIAFRERSRPTLIRTPAGDSIPSEGSVWVQPVDGTVVRTILKVAGFARPPARGARGTGVVDVTYTRVPELGVWLPSSMDEDFEVAGRNETETISGRALYSNYRQFQTTVRIK